MSVALRFAGRALAAAVVIVAAFALVAGVIVPRLAGATPYTVLSGSMEPTLRIGDLIVVRSGQQIGTGDVITYQVESGQEQVVTHRVTGLGMTASGERVYRTRGDANEAADVTPVREVQVRGTLWYQVPLLGYVASWFSGGQRQSIATGAAVALLGYAAWNVVRAARERRAGAELRHEESETGDTRVRVARENAGGAE